MSDIKCRIYPLWHTLAECCPGHTGHGMNHSTANQYLRIPARHEIPLKLGSGFVEECLCCDGLRPSHGEKRP